MKKRFLFFLFVGLWAVIVNGHNDSLPALDKLADRLQRFGERIPQEKVFVHIDNTSEFHLTPQDEIRHMNIRFYKMGIEGNYQEIKVPGTQTKNYHKFLDFKY